MRGVNWRYSLSRERRRSTSKIPRANRSSSLGKFEKPDEGQGMKRAAVDQQDRDKDKLNRVKSPEKDQAPAEVQPPTEEQAPVDPALVTEETEALSLKVTKEENVTISSDLSSLLMTAGLLQLLRKPTPKPSTPRLTLLLMKLLCLSMRMREQWSTKKEGRKLK